MDIVGIESEPSRRNLKTQRNRGVKVLVMGMAQAATTGDESSFTFPRAKHRRSDVAAIQP